MPKANPLSRAKKIKLIIFDVDGVLTDGKLYFVPIPSLTQQNADGQPAVGLSSPGTIEVKAFHAHDGTAISLARLGGIRTGVVTKRISETVALRARDLKMDFVYQGIADKLGAIEEIIAKAGLTSAQVAFVGDDVIDLPAMRGCGFAIAVANARDEVKREAHLVTKTRGGEGAARDAVEYILKAQGTLARVVSEYICERSAVGAKVQGRLKQKVQAKVRPKLSAKNAAP